MSIVQMKNPELYRMWIDYLEKVCPERPGHTIRCEAFFHSTAGKRPPIIR